MVETTTIEITVNGQSRRVAEATTVARLLQTLQVAPERVVVEVNVTILKRAEHAQRILQPGDQVEIVRLVGGGSQSSGW